MKDILRRAAILLMLAFAPSNGAAEPWAQDADVVFLGEQHDNAAHHRRQAQIVSALKPKAMVFEMLTPSQAARITPEVLAEERTLAATLGWEEAGWPDFGMYHPIFLEAFSAQIYGAAVPLEQSRAVLSTELARVFGPDAARYGLDRPLPALASDERQAQLLDAQGNRLARGDAAGLMRIQRLRDATLARAALEAVEATDGPVVVITSNSHARSDRGAPLLLKQAAPHLKVATLGQGELGRPAPAGLFDRIEFADPTPRQRGSVQV